MTTIVAKCRHWIPIIGKLFGSKSLHPPVGGVGTSPGMSRHYLVFGDAIASFNPIHGQGTSVAALESEELASVLEQGSGELLGPRFFRRAAKIADIPWAISVGNDLRMPKTIGPRNIGVNFINWYICKLHKTAHADPIAALAFFRVANLLAPPPSVLHPKIAWRVLIGGFRSRTAQQTKPAHDAADDGSTQSPTARTVNYGGENAKLPAMADSGGNGRHHGGGGEPRRGAEQI